MIVPAAQFGGDGNWRTRVRSWRSPRRSCSGGSPHAREGPPRLVLVQHDRTRARADRRDRSQYSAPPAAVRRRVAWRLLAACREQRWSDVGTGRLVHGCIRGDSPCIDSAGGESSTVAACVDSVGIVRFRSARRRQPAELNPTVAVVRCQRSRRLRRRSRPEFVRNAADGPSLGPEQPRLRLFRKFGSGHRTHVRIDSGQTRVDSSLRGGVV